MSEAKTSLFDMTGSIHIDGLGEMQAKFDKLNETLTKTVALLERIDAKNEKPRENMHRIVFTDDDYIDFPADSYEAYSDNPDIMFYKNDNVVACAPRITVKYILSK